MTFVTFVIGAVAGFVGGVLFGRRNKNKVETAVSEGKEVLNKVSGGKL